MYVMYECMAELNKTETINSLIISELINVNFMPEDMLLSMFINPIIRGSSPKKNTLDVSLNFNMFTLESQEKKYYSTQYILIGQF